MKTQEITTQNKIIGTVGANPISLKTRNKSASSTLSCLFYLIIFHIIYLDQALTFLFDGSSKTHLCFFHIIIIIIATVNTLRLELLFIFLYLDLIIVHSLKSQNQVICIVESCYLVDHRCLRVKKYYFIYFIGYLLSFIIFTEIY